MYGLGGKVVSVSLTPDTLEPVRLEVEGAPPVHVAREEAGQWARWLAEWAEKKL